MGRLSCRRLVTSAMPCGVASLPARTRGTCLAPGPMKKMAKTPTVMSQSTMMPWKMRRSRKRATRNSLDEQAAARVERVPHAITKEVERKAGDQQRQAGEDQVPPRAVLEHALRIGDHRSPDRKSTRLNS